MKDPQVREILVEIARRPMTEWEPLLACRFPDNPLLVQQGLLWLYALDSRGHRDARPSLGAVGDQRYELAVKLDSGATASVWQAFDRKLGRTVAIKILHAPLGTSMLTQLVTEARAACDVISDQVVRILDVQDDEPRSYIVMELVGEHDPDRGELVLGTAASTCRPRSVTEVARWVMQVARGVHDAHARNVFHRDLKPDNVLITPLSRNARIADFGLAVSAASEHTDAKSTSLVTRGSMGPITVSGTPEYMAPEQARGLPLYLDPRIGEDRAVLVGVDVWGLGALAYDLLVGHPPWLPESGEHEPWELAASGARPRLVDRTPWGERIPSRLRRIVDKALASEPSDRYESAARVANELEAFQARRPTSFDRGRHIRLGLWCRRNPQLTLTGLAVVALILLTLGTRATVTRLRRERDGLNREVASQQSELGTLTSNVNHTRDELTKTEQKLEQGASDLAKLEQSIEQERTANQNLLQKKDARLREATTTTRQLLDQLDAANAGAQRLQGELAASRRDAEAAGKDRDRIRGERDKARSERETMKTQRDGAIADREAMKAQRDGAIADRDEARRALAKLQQELARLATDRADNRDTKAGARN